MAGDSFDDDEEEVEGPRSSFGTYFAEGDNLYKQGEYKKALESYSLALEIQANDKTCLVARSKCYLKLGDPVNALADAEASLEEDKYFHKGLYQKAEALYSMGDFEYALMYYHRGHKNRPELDEFRLGIQKAQEAIDNSIGSAAKIKLENKGDLSFFTKQDDHGNKKRGGGYAKAATTNKPKPITNRNKEVKPAAPSKKTVKQLLGELYADKEYLEKLINDRDFVKEGSNTPIYELVKGGLTYLETRTEFWRQQKPLYARKKEKLKPTSKESRKKKKANSIGKYIVKQLEEIDEALLNGEPDKSLTLATNTLKSVEMMLEMDLPNKKEVIANLHSCIGNAYVEMEQYDKALKHHLKDLEISKKGNMKDGKSRALDNVGRVYARKGKYAKAVSSWTEKIPLIKTPLEGTWLYHEIGRCHLELNNFEEAKECGEKSLAAGKEADDDVWELNASVLIAQAEVKMGNLQNAIDAFTDALDFADQLGDEGAQKAITKALADLNAKMEQDGEPVKIVNEQISDKNDDRVSDDADSEHEDVNQLRVTSDTEDEASKTQEKDSSKLTTTGTDQDDTSKSAVDTSEKQDSSTNEGKTDTEGGKLDNEDPSASKSVSKSVSRSASHSESRKSASRSQSRTVQEDKPETADPYSNEGFEDEETDREVTPLPSDAEEPTTTSNREVTPTPSQTDETSAAVNNDTAASDTSDVNVDSGDVGANNSQQDPDETDGNMNTDTAVSDADASKADEETSARKPITPEATEKEATSENAEVADTSVASNDANTTSNQNEATPEVANSNQETTEVSTTDDVTATSTKSDTTPAVSASEPDVSEK